MSKGNDEVTSSEEWDPMDELLITLLAEGWTHRRIAAFGGISTKTIQRRLKEPEFTEEVTLRKRERLTTVAIRLINATDAAIDVLIDAMAVDDVRVRMRAAQALIGYAGHFHQRVLFEADIEQRIAGAERKLAGFRDDEFENGGERAHFRITDSSDTVGRSDVGPSPSGEAGTSDSELGEPSDDLPKGDAGHETNDDDDGDPR